VQPVAHAQLRTVLKKDRINKIVQDLRDCIMELCDKKLTEKSIPCACRVRDALGFAAT
jgi:hypothetical protein